MPQLIVGIWLLLVLGATIYTYLHSAREAVEDEAMNQEDSENG